MKSVIILIFSILSQIIYSQTIEIKGKIIDVSNNAVPYVNIGVLNKPIGTVSDDDGNFRLSLQKEHLNDTLKISSLGYKSRIFLISKLANKNEPIHIELREQIQHLDEVVIYSKNLKTYTKGRTKTNTNQKVIFAKPEMKNINLGSEIGRKFKLDDDKPSYLTQFKFFIKNNNFDFVKFRINVYTIKDNRPGKKLNTQNIFTSAENSYTGWIIVDLTSYNIVVQEDIIVAVEWIEHSEKGNTLNLPIIIPSFGSTHYYKFGSQNSWKKYGSMSSAMELTYKQ